MVNRTLFEILVYSCTQEEFNRRATEEVDRFMNDVPKYEESFWQEQRQQELQARLHPIKYNEVVGSIEVYALGTQLRADYWFTEKSRIIIGSGTARRIRWMGKLVECRFSSQELSDATSIFRKFRKALDSAIGDTRSLKGRFVDFDAFDRCGPLLDWASAIRKCGDRSGRA